MFLSVTFLFKSLMSLLWNVYGNRVYFLNQETKFLVKTLNIQAHVNILAYE